MKLLGMVTLIVVAGVVLDFAASMLPQSPDAILAFGLVLFAGLSVGAGAVLVAND